MAAPRCPEGPYLPSGFCLSKNVTSNFASSQVRSVMFCDRAGEPSEPVFDIDFKPTANDPPSAGTVSCRAGRGRADASTNSTITERTRIARIIARLVCQIVCHQGVEDIEPRNLMGEMVSRALLRRSAATADSWPASRSSARCVRGAKAGEPRWNRTSNPQIKSLLLCQLS
jgi:hypothetical protein